MWQRPRSFGWWHNGGIFQSIFGSPQAFRNLPSESIMLTIDYHLPPIFFHKRRSLYWKLSVVWTSRLLLPTIHSTRPQKMASSRSSTRFTEKQNAMRSKEGPCFLKISLWSEHLLVRELGDIGGILKELQSGHIRVDLQFQMLSKDSSVELDRPSASRKPCI